MKINKPLALLQALFFSGLGHFQNWQRGSGTQMRHTRDAGERKEAGTKLGRMAAEHRLDGTSPGGLVSESFRNMKIQNNQARIANEKGEPEPEPVEHQRVQGW